MLEDGREIAFLDVREVVPFGAGHPLLATNLPIGHIEGEIARLVPRLDTRVVVTDGGEGLSAVAARRLADLGYDNVAVLAGGAPAWAAADVRLASGSKTVTAKLRVFAGNPDQLSCGDTSSPPAPRMPPTCALANGCPSATDSEVRVNLPSCGRNS